jgi:PIN domain nuclease of toxin-antitoxin system
MRYLLDTHVLAWAVGDASKLSHSVQQILRDLNNEIFVSPINIWEMSIKFQLGKWPDVAAFMDEATYDSFLTTLGAKEIVITHRHTRLAGQFKEYHSDPFDRLLIAQALLEGMAFISKDRALDVFAVRRMW